MEIVKVQKKHHDQIEKLLNICFGDDRKSRTAYAIRIGTKMIDEYSLLMTHDDMLIGSISCWPIALNNPSTSQTIPMIMVGPIAINPEHQSNGYGRILVENVIEKTENADARPLIMIGDPEYYGRFEFHAMLDNEWQLPGPFEKHRLLVRSNMELPLIGIVGPDKMTASDKESSKGSL